VIPRAPASLEEAADTKGLLLHALYAYDESRGRSQQKALGASEIGGCRRRSFYRMVEYPEVNFVRKLAAASGSAMHQRIEDAFRFLDPKGERFLPEVEVPGVLGMGPGHVDLVDLHLRKASDWKTTKKKNLRYFPKTNQRWQVQIYGDLLVKAGYEIDTVELVAIPLDGVEEDIRVHSEPRDPEVAAQAYAWLTGLHEMRDNGELPPAELSGKICEEYCPYFGPDSCGGK